MLFFVASTTEISSKNVILKMQSLLLEAEKSLTSPKQEVSSVPGVVLYLIIADLGCSCNFRFIPSEYSIVWIVRSEKCMDCANWDKV